MRAAWLPFAMPTPAATINVLPRWCCGRPCSLRYSPFSEGPCALGFAVSRNGGEMHAPLTPSEADRVRGERARGAAGRAAGGRLYTIACKGAEGAQGFVRIASCGRGHRATCTGGIADTDMPRGGAREGLL
ncbi:hypothetical protein B0H14DRAFT_2959761 [Mycena olivaceomarginata]|nr:hypothetical protein B0H14DRAFT_2959761 [Mycena olivaceomarginata]